MFQCSSVMFHICFVCLSFPFLLIFFILSIYLPTISSLWISYPHSYNSVPFQFIICLWLVFCQSLLFSYPLIYHSQQQHQKLSTLTYHAFPFLQMHRWDLVRRRPHPLVVAQIISIPAFPVHQWHLHHTPLQHRHHLTQPQHHHVLRTHR